MSLLIGIICIIKVLKLRQKYNIYSNATRVVSKLMIFQYPVLVPQV